MQNNRKSALELGELTYMTGLVCPHGHTDVRYAKTGQCKSCTREAARKNWVNKTGKNRKRWTTTEIAEAFGTVHGSMYDYSQVVYSTHKHKIHVVCPSHGGFYMTPDNHLQGKGCPACSNEQTGARCRGDLATFLEAAKKLWGSAWDYSKCTYTVAHNKMVFGCRLHGDFKQTATNHLSGKSGCRQCNHMNSKEEDAILRHMAKFTPAVQRDRTQIKPKELDIYLPDRQLAIEYCGMYWHSHFDAENEKANKRKHAEKHAASAAAGIRLITIYEYEWQTRQPQIKRLLRNAVGASRGKLMARKCELRKVTTPEARQFFESYHPQGGAGGGEHYGLYWKDKLVACMRFAFGQNDRGNAVGGAAWTLGRFATRVNVSGAASRLFKAFVKDVGPAEVKSFSDNRFATFAHSLAVKMNRQESRPGVMITFLPISLRNLTGRETLFLSSIVWMYSPINIISWN